MASETDSADNTGSASLTFTLDTDTGETVSLSLASTLVGSAGAHAEHFTISDGPFRSPACRRIGA